MRDKGRGTIASRHFVPRPLHLHTMPQKLKPYEVERQMELFLEEKYLKDIASKLENKDRNSWHYQWEDHLRRFFTNNDRLDTNLNFLDVMLTEVDRFVYYCERTLASVMYDALITLMHHKLGIPWDDLDKREQMLLMIYDRASSMFPDWDDTLETLGMYESAHIEYFFDYTFILMCNPTHRRLALPDQEEDELDKDLMYLYGVALYLTYEQFKESHG